jgi:hypothetical protein
MKPEYHQKGWGYEMWIHNDADYCGKLLFFEKGKRCSYHYHKLKTETFYLQDGKMLIMHGDSDNYGEAKETLLQMVALTDCNLFEFSTQHFEEDSYRVLKGD